MLKYLYHCVKAYIYACKYRKCCDCNNTMLYPNRYRYFDLYSEERSKIVLIARNIMFGED